MYMNERNEMFLNPLDRQFIRILTDFGFKRMFGSKEHAGLLMRFLNALFEGKMVIKSVEFRDKEVLPFHPNGKKILYDIYCTTDRGEHFILAKKWWLAPLLFILLIVGLLVIFADSAVAPFIYSLF